MTFPVQFYFSAISVDELSIAIIIVLYFWLMSMIYDVWVWDVEILYNNSVCKQNTVPKSEINI